MTWEAAALEMGPRGAAKLFSHLERDLETAADKPTSPGTPESSGEKSQMEACLSG